MAERTTDAAGAVAGADGQRDHVLSIAIALRVGGTVGLVDDGLIDLTERLRPRYERAVVAL